MKGINSHSSLLRNESGKVLKVLGIGCATVVVIGVIAAFVIYNNIKNIATSVGRAIIVAVIEDLEIPEDQKKGFIGHVDRVVTAYKKEEITTEQVGKIMAEMVGGPMFTMIMISAADPQYIQPSGLDDEQKKRGKLDLQRFGRGVADEKIKNEDIQAVMDLISVQTAEGKKEIKKKLTDEEIVAFLAAVRKKADEAKVPEELDNFDPVAEFGKAIDRVLKAENGK